MSEPNPEEVKRVVAFLNQLLATDGDAVRPFFRVCVPCNQQMMAHPTVQVGGSDESPTLSMLGIFNGLMGIYSTGVKRGRGPIEAVIDARTDELLYFTYSENIGSSHGEKRPR